MSVIRLGAGVSEARRGVLDLYVGTAPLGLWGGIQSKRKISAPHREVKGTFQPVEGGEGENTGHQG